MESKLALSAVGGILYPPQFLVLHRFLLPSCHAPTPLSLSCHTLSSSSSSTPVKVQLDLTLAGSCLFGHCQSESHSHQHHFKRIHSHSVLVLLADPNQIQNHPRVRFQIPIPGLPQANHVLYSTRCHHGGCWVPLDAIDDGAVSTETPYQISTGLLPDEDVAIVTAGCDVVAMVSNKDSLFDVCVSVAVSAEPRFVVRDVLLGSDVAVSLIGPPVVGVVVGMVTI